jgi:hypothetical protein
VRIATPLGDTALLRVLGEGQYFGELAVVAPAPRSATIVCLEVVETLALHRDVLEGFASSIRHWKVSDSSAGRRSAPGVELLLIEALYLPVDYRGWRRVAEPGRGVRTCGRRCRADPTDAGRRRPPAGRRVRARTRCCVGEERGVLRIGRGASRCSTSSRCAPGPLDQTRADRRFRRPSSQYREPVRRWLCPRDRRGRSSSLRAVAPRVWGTVRDAVRPRQDDLRRRSRKTSLRPSE